MYNQLQFQANLLTLSLTSLIVQIMTMDNERKKELRFVFRKKKKAEINKKWDTAMMAEVKMFAERLLSINVPLADKYTGCVYKEEKQKYIQ